MSKANKRRASLRKELERKLAARRKQTLPPAADLSEAHRLMEEGDWGAARKHLEELSAQHPGQTEVLWLLPEVYHQQRDYQPHTRVTKQLLERERNIPSLALSLAAAYLNLARPVSAYLAFSRYLKRWPDDPLADGVRKTMSELEQGLEESLPFTGEDRWEIASLHEGALSAMEAGDNHQVIELCEKLARRAPEFLPVKNNLSHAYFQTGRTSQALEIAREVLLRDPDNTHALANLARFLFLSGRQDEARETANRLLAVPTARGDSLVKRAELFSLLGEDERVIEAYREAEAAGFTSRPTRDIALLHHYTAVACARQGRDGKARRHWRAALEISPMLQVPQQNLDDWEKPVGERHAPWAFPFTAIVHGQRVLEMATEFRQRQDDDEGTTQAARAVIEKHPELLSLLPVLLDRGDRKGREFALQLAMLLDTPEADEMLWAFCTSQRGPDAARTKAAQCLKEKGKLPPGPVRMWIGGQWREMELMAYEIVTEPMGEPFPPEVEVWVQDALDALREDDGVTAERLLKQSLEKAGERPSLLNNLASAYLAQGRDEEAGQLLRSINERWPDYLFGITNLASLAIANGNLEEAKSRLKQLRYVQRLHITEYDALAAVYVQLAIARGNLDAAESWLTTWEQISPDHHHIRRLRNHIIRLSMKTGWLQKLVDE